MGRTPSPAQAARNKLGGTIRRHQHDPDHPEVLAARVDLAVENLAAHIRRVAAAAPPLTPEHAAYLRGLLPLPAATATEVSRAAS